MFAWSAARSAMLVPAWSTLRLGPAGATPEPFGFRGREAIGAFYRSEGFSGLPITLVPTRANDQPAFGYYLPDANAAIRRGSGILVLTVSASRISTITRFGDRGLLDRFGLPRTLASP